MSGVPRAAIAAIARAQLRRRWPALVALGLLAGLVGALVVGAGVVARRTGTAYDRLETATRVDDARLDVFAGADVADRIAALPVVRESWMVGAAVGQLQSQEVTYLGVLSGPPAPRDLFAPLVVEGRMYRDGDPSEVLVTEAFARARAVGVGDVLQLRFLTPAQFAQFDTGFGEPGGPAVDLRVVGVVRTPGDPESLPPLLASPAFAARYGNELTAAHKLFLRLRDGERSIPELDRELERLRKEVPAPPEGAEEFTAFEVSYPSRAAVGVRSTARVLVTGLALLAGMAGAVGLLALAQAFGRHHASGAGDQTIEEVLGLTRPHQVLARMVAALLSAAIAAAGAAAGGLAAGWLEPMGAIRRYEPHGGWSPNLGLAAGGALAAGAAVLGMAAFTAWRAGSSTSQPSPQRPNSLAEQAQALGARPSLVVGLRMALERGAGRTAVPVRASLVGVAVAAAGLVATATFASSLHRLLVTPARYGWQGDFVVVDVSEPVVADLVSDRRFGSVAVSSSTTLRVGGRDVRGFSLEVAKGSMAWSLTEGRMPSGPEEITLGTRLARELDRASGDEVEIADAEGRHHRLRVVGVGLWATFGGGELGSNAALSPEGLARYGLGEPFREAVVRVVEGDPDAVAAQVAGELEVSRRELPADVDNLRQLGGLPLVLGGFLVAVGISTLAHGATVAVRRRAGDLAVLRALGFTPGQAGGSVLVMAVTTVVVGVVVGTPLGLAAGNLAWRSVASGAAVAGDAVFPVLLFALLAPAAAAAALLVAALPARRAALLRPAVALRTE